MTPDTPPAKVTFGLENPRLVADAVVNGRKVGTVEVDLDDSNLDDSDRTRIVAELQRGADTGTPH